MIDGPQGASYAYAASKSVDPDHEPIFGAELLYSFFYMLATGIRTPVGIKVLGTDLAEMEKAARQVEAVIKAVPGTASAYAELLHTAGWSVAVARQGDRVPEVWSALTTRGVLVG